jgi:uncharacterized membrane protein
VTDPLHQAKRPVSLLAGTYGHPSHPMLVTVPIGAWVAGSVFDVSSRLVDQPGFLAQGALWLIGIGVLGALAAACAGFLDLFAIPAGTQASRTALTHMGLNLAVTATYALAFVWRLGDYHHPAGVPVPKIVLSAACLAVLAVSGFLGGRLAYRYGVRVADETTQAGGFTHRTRPGPAAGASTGDRS